MSRLAVCLTLFLCCIAPVAVVTAAPFGVPENSVAAGSEELNRAEELLRAGQEENALSLLRGMLVRYPGSPLVVRANLLLARIFFDRGEFSTAREYLNRTPANQKTPERDLLVGALRVAEGEIQPGMDLLRDLPEDTLAPTDRALRAEAMARGSEALGQPVKALYFWHQAAQVQSDANKTEALVRAHELLIEIDEAALEEAAFMLQGTPVGQDAALQLAQRLTARGQVQPALSVVQQVVFDPTPFPYRSEAVALFDRLRGRPWLQRAIGVLLPFSGRYAAFGSLVQRGMELAVDLHNRSQSPVRFIYRDVGLGGDQARTEVHRLANEERVSALAGPITGAAAEAAAEQAQLEEIPLLALSQRTGLPLMGNWIFRDALTLELQARALARYAVLERGMTSFAVLYPENRLGREMTRLFAQEVLALNGLVIAQTSYPEDATDFRRQIRALMGKDPDGRDDPDALSEQEILEDLFEPDFPPVDFDALVIPDYADKVGLIAPQLPFYGIKDVQLLGINGWNSPDLIRNAGVFVEGAVFVDGFFRNSPYPFVREFVELFLEKYQEEPSILEAQGFDVANILLNLMDLPETRTREDLRLGLWQVRNYPGVTGATSFDTQGEAEKELFLLQVQNGDIVQIN